MKYIIFSKIDRYYILFLTYFIIIIIKEIVKDLYRTTDDIIESFNRYYSYTISDLLSIIPIIIIKIRSKSDLKKANTTEKEKMLQNLKYKYTNTIKIEPNIRKRRIIKLEIVISIVDFFGKYSDVIFSIILSKTNYFIKKIKLSALYMVNIIVTYILSIFILHKQFYRHNYFSLIITLIFLIVLVVIEQINIFKEINIFKDDEWELKILYIVMRLLINIFYCLEDIYGKVLLSIESISIYKLLFYRGIMVSIITFIFSIVFIFVDIPDENGENSIVFTRFWKVYENKLNILYNIGIILINFIYNIHIFYIIDKFSPSHYAMATILDSFGSFLIAIFKRSIEIEEFIIRFIFCLILIFAGLIYNEIIILNFCGLQRYTKLFLQNEANTDISQTKIKNTTFTESEVGNEEELINQEIINSIKLKEFLDEEDNESSINTN